MGSQRLKISFFYLSFHPIFAQSEINHLPLKNGCIRLTMWLVASIKLF